MQFMPITRRSFLAASAALTAFPAVAALPASGQVDVVIIGAGVAGIAAGRRLAAAGKRIALVEASDRVGGRCVTDDHLFGVPYDRGARWLHTADVNPLTPLAAAAKIDVEKAPAGYSLRVGRRNAREGEMEEFLAAFFRSRRSISEAGRGKTDMACLRALPKDLGALGPVIEFVLGPFQFGKDLAEISAMDFARAADRDGDAFCRQGLGTLVARLAQGLPIQRSAAVTRINFSGRAVMVETTAGNLTAPSVIITVSTNVLASGKIKFTPALPKRVLDAAARLSLGSYDHIVLELAGNPLGLQNDEIVFEKAAGQRTAALLANIRDTSLCVIEVGGSFGRSLSAQGEAAMTAFGIEWLSDLYGAGIRDSVRRRHATQWNAEPWTLGAFSGASPGFSGARRALMEPVSNRLFFAGEAAHETLWGTVGGAWESGERVAEAIINGPVGSVPGRQQRRPRRR